MEEDNNQIEKYFEHMKIGRKTKISFIKTLKNN